MVPDPEVSLVVKCFQVYNDLAGQHYMVELEDLVRTMDDAKSPGLHRATIISLMNAEVLDRHPEATALTSAGTLSVTADEFSDIKIQVLQNLLHWIKTGGRQVM